MKIFKRTTFILLVTVLTACNAQPQGEKEINYILDKLHEVEELDVLHSKTAYVIDSDGNKTTYDQFKGKWLFIDFWSTGCSPCIKEFPALAKFSKKSKDKINVIAVSVDSKFERYKKSAKKYQINVPHYFGGYTYKNQLFSLNIKALKANKGGYTFRTMTPQYVLIDPDGKIVDKDFPKPSSIDFQEKLQKAFDTYE